MKEELINFTVYYLYGVLVTLEFDIFRILRKNIKHKNWIVFVEDLLFLFSCFTIFLIIFFKISFGIIRLYIFLGIILGILTYYKIIIKKIAKNKGFFMIL